MASEAPPSELRRSSCSSSPLPLPTVPLPAAPPPPMSPHPPHAASDGVACRKAPRSFRGRRVFTLHAPLAAALPRGAAPAASRLPRLLVRRHPPHGCACATGLQPWRRQQPLQQLQTWQWQQPRRSQRQARRVQSEEFRARRGRDDEKRAWDELLRQWLSPQQPRRRFRRRRPRPAASAA